MDTKHAKELILTGLGTLLAALVVGRLTAHGDVSMPKSVLSGGGMLVLGVLSYTFVLWRRDQHRERIRFAEEHEWLVCHCTQEGTICVMKYTKEGPGYHHCPACKNDYPA